MPDNAVGPSDSTIQDSINNLVASHDQSQSIPDAWFREDGTLKGPGYFGLLQSPQGHPISEYSIADSEQLKDKFDNYISYPSIVPTLTSDEVQSVLNAADNKTPIPDSVYSKAEAFALQRQQQGLPLFAQMGEQSNAYPELKRMPLPKVISDNYQRMQTPQRAVSPTINDKPFPFMTGHQVVPRIDLLK